MDGRIQLMINTIRDSIPQVVRDTHELKYVSTESLEIDHAILVKNGETIIQWNREVYNFLFKLLE